MSRTGNGNAIRWLRDKTASPGSECILWPFARNPDGRARCGNPRTKKVDFAYRVAWEIYRGAPWPAALEARHSCGNGAGGCINPRHVIPGTHAENERDKIAHGTSSRGSRNGNAMLSEDGMANAMRRVAGGEALQSVADNLGVSRQALSDAWNGKSWRHVDAPRRGDLNSERGTS